MRLVIDYDSGKIVQAFGSSSELTEIRLKRAVSAVIEVQFVQAGQTVIELPVDATGRLEFKETGKYDAEPLTGAASWDKVGSGTSTYYRFTFALINEDLDDLFFVDDDEDNDVAQLSLMAEISWKYAARDYKTQTFTAKIDNDVNRDADTIPESPAVVYTRGAVRFTTDDPPDDSVGLDGDIFIHETLWKVWAREGGVYVFKGVTKGTDGIDGDDGTDGEGYLATSTSSFAIGTGSKTFVTQTGLAYSVGCRVRVSDSADVTKWMEGLVTAYSGTNLTVLVDKVSGTGTIATWDINVAGEPGIDGGGIGTTVIPTLEMIYNDDTTPVSAPTDGHIGGNNGTFKSSTLLWMSLKDANGASIEDVIDGYCGSVQGGYLLVRPVAAPQELAVFQIMPNTLDFPGASNQTVGVRASFMHRFFSVADGDALLVTFLPLPPTQSTSTNTSTPNPTGTTSTGSYKMMGLGAGGATITPRRAGRFLAIITGSVTSSGSPTTDGGLIRLKAGVGTPPANGDGETGTTCGNTIDFILGGSGEVVPFCLVANCGADIGVVNWVDLALKAVTAGTFAVKDIHVELIDIF